MRLLLDTHVWLWGVLEPDRLSHDAKEAIRQNRDRLHLSPASTWEAMILARKGKVRLGPTPREGVVDALRRSALHAVPLSHEIALRSESLDGFDSRDPADRFLVATALEHDLTLVTADERMRAYERAEDDLVVAGDSWFERAARVGAYVRVQGDARERGEGGEEARIGGFGLRKKVSKATEVLPRTTIVVLRAGE